MAFNFLEMLRHWAADTKSCKFWVGLGDTSNGLRLYGELSSANNLGWLFHVLDVIESRLKLNKSNYWTSLTYDVQFGECSDSQLYRQFSDPSYVLYGTANTDILSFCGWKCDEGLSLWSPIDWGSLTLQVVDWYNIYEGLWLCGCG